ncbi:MAG: phosphomethylpyrimidine synthase ThiC, partial [Deltaproteobacteria bacterium]|nr:phosphomethylpyrimidine synthase ThiC [Deltaproteobacteria bacterium]
MSIREDAINRNLTPLFEACAKNEAISPEALMAGVAQGVIAIPKNKNHNFERIMAVGKGLSTKVNANIGASRDMPGLEQELEKLCVSLKAGADTVMDLSMGENLN